MKLVLFERNRPGAALSLISCPGAGAVLASLVAAVPLVRPLNP